MSAAENPRAVPGDNSSHAVAADELRSFLERVERLEEEKAGIASDVKEVVAELKGRGYDVKAFRSLLRLRKKDQATRQEEAAILRLYADALGMGDIFG